MQRKRSVALVRLRTTSPAIRHSEFEFLRSVAKLFRTHQASYHVDVLEQILDSDDAKDRLNAVKMILTHLVPLAEHAELRERLDRLEQSSALKVVS
jgi:hypothetical protein